MLETATNTGVETKCSHGYILMELRSVLKLPVEIKYSQ